MIIMEANPGEEVKDFAVRMIQRAHEKQEIVLGEFNQFTFEAKPSSCETIANVIKPYEDHSRCSYFVDDK